MKHTCHSESSQTGCAPAGIGFVSESSLKVECVNPPANGLAKASLLFRTQPLSTEGVSTRLISGGSPEVPPAIRAPASGGASTQTRLMEPQITPLSRSPTHMHSLSRGYSSACEVGWLPWELKLLPSAAWHSHLLTPIALFNTSVCIGKWQDGKQPTAIFSGINPPPQKKKTKQGI